MPGERRPAVDPFAPFLDYVTARLIQDPHLWPITLFDELVALGFVLSYQTLTREIRGPLAAAGLHAVRDRDRPGERDHRAPARCRDAVGLARSAGSARGLGLGAPRRWSGRWPIRGGGAATWRPRWISRIWLRGWTGSAGVWAG